MINVYLILHNYLDIALTVNFTLHIRLFDESAIIFAGNSCWKAIGCFIAAQ